MDWTSGDEDERQAEWAGVGRHRLAMSVDIFHCPWCGRDAEWSAWVTAGGPDGPLTCPSCHEPLADDAVPLQ